MVGLEKYKIKDKASYEKIKPLLEGWCFFRHQNDEYYVKAPKNNQLIKDLIENNIIFVL